MATENHHQGYNSYRVYNQSVVPQKLVAPSVTPMPTDVQSLNNRACVLMAMGNFPKANCLFEIALKVHKEMAVKSVAPASSQLSNCFSTATIDLEYDSDSDMEDDFDDDDENDFANEWEGRPLAPNHNEPSKRLLVPSNYLHQNLNQECSGIRRLTSSSRIRTFSYGGQRDKRSPSKWVFHQVYSLPIVMTPGEWETATMSDRSFVLIFNSAVCNHLWGMELITRREQNGASGGVPPHAYKRSFEIARMLYKLALEHVSNSQRTNNGSREAICGVDRLCYSAVFNNLSHLCKALDGYESYDAYKYDTFLLKSLYWLIDSNQCHSSSSNGVRQESHQTAHYDEDDAEVLDAFLENVFYLIGVPPAVVPAPAA